MNIKIVCGMENLSYMLQQSVASFFKTGNVILDMVIIVFVCGVLQKITSWDFNFFNSILNLCRRRKNIKSEYIIEGKIKNTSEMYNIFNSVSIPIQFKALMYKVSTGKVNIKSVRQYDKSAEMVAGKNFSFVINDTDDIQINDDIWIRQVNEINRSEDIKVEVESYRLFVFSFTLTFDELHGRITEWVEEYDEYLRSLDDDENIYYYSYFGCEGAGGSKVLTFDRSIFVSNKRFDNIFFEGKNELIERLDYFLEGEENYKRLGTPYTLGLLFYGDPGCGKTSTVKAIANYTKRNIISIPLARVETCRELTKIFIDEFIVDRYVPIDSRLYVFEDIDCMSNIVMDRDQNVAVPKEEEETNKVVVCLKDRGDGEGVGIMSAADKKEKDKLTLSYLLNMIDGVLEQSGRIIIMTTNKPEKIDKALLRPGRIDMKIHFGKCVIGVIREILELFYKDEIGGLAPFKLPVEVDKKFTAAEIFEICYNSKKFDDAYKKLVYVSV
ncbi:MAG: putative AAA+ family ATPase [Hyperionvirus sp.]|uniref:Putative AAA+ family ATPase n=1 Tax=Hyperionvirus sp. TaxID=2487770 RepID=A0A3G5A8P5_9VIRU|nr:MAG: putative AAA+ family ATPase [Hyperionvirus sp.]